MESSARDCLQSGSGIAVRKKTDTEDIFGRSGEDGVSAPALVELPLKHEHEHARAKLADAKAENSNKRRVFKQLVPL